VNRYAIIRRGPGQVGIREVLVSSDGTVGWLAGYRVNGVSDPVALTLTIWRAGNIVRRFEADQSFYSWAFYAAGKQVAYHVGPLHGEGASHCETHLCGLRVLDRRPRRSRQGLS
jgi:hypothetical protein